MSFSLLHPDFYCPFPFLWSSPSSSLPFLHLSSPLLLFLTSFTTTLCSFLCSYSCLILSLLLFVSVSLEVILTSLVLPHYCTCSHLSSSRSHPLRFPYVHASALVLVSLLLCVPVSLERNNGVLSSLLIAYQPSSSQGSTHNLPVIIHQSVITPR